MAAAAPASLISRPLTRLFAVVVVLACFASSASAAEPTATPQPLGADALWAWWWPTDDALVERAEESGFSRVYLYAEGGFDTKVRKAIAALGASGVEVEALGGENRWATTQRDGMLSFVRAANRYQRSAPPGAGLAGVHVDVEPYDLPAWDRDQGRVAGSLVSSLRAAHRTGDLPLSADIPFWFDGMRMPGSDRTVVEGIMANTDSTTVMAYRDSGPEVINAARSEVRAAAKLGKSTVVGVETGDVSPASVTFFEEGRAALSAAIADISSGLGDQPGFGGVAVHHLESLGSLKP